MENNSKTQFEYEVRSEISEEISQPFQLLNLATSEEQQILCVNMQKQAIFPEHTSPRDATLIVLEGKITFHIDEKQFHLSKHRHFRFPKEVAHWVKADENSKFLIIR